MVVRRVKKIRKKRGRLRARSGEIRRGAGNRGGRGNAGVGKKGTEHKRMLYVYLMGKRGFKRSLFTSEKKYINVGDLDRMLDAFLKRGVAVKREDYYLLDLKSFGFDKLLGRGSVKNKYYIIIDEFTKSAKRKIEALGGKIIEER